MCRLIQPPLPCSQATSRSPALLGLKYFDSSSYKNFTLLDKKGNVCLCLFTEPHHSYPSCTFDFDNECGWMIEGVGFKWFTTNNSYIDDNNLLGPIGPTSGNFLYASAKSGIPGEETFITSPSFTNDVNGTCMIFSFSMFVSILRDEKVIIGNVLK